MNLSKVWHKTSVYVMLDSTEPTYSVKLCLLLYAEVRHRMCKLDVKCAAWYVFSPPEFFGNASRQSRGHDSCHLL
jgi:hypothetical protein